MSIVGVSAQTLPISTDAESPLWYYIHADGQEVWTASGTDITTDAIITAADDESLANQLWRFEGNAADGYIITNKATNQQVCIIYSIVLKKVVTRLLKTEKYRFVCQTQGDGIQLISQTSAGANYSSDVALCVDSALNGRVIAAPLAKATTLSLEPYADHELSLSDEGANYWYRISSCAEGLENYAISSTDNPDALPLPLLNSEITDSNSLWMITKTADNLLQFTNRATGRVIAASSICTDNYNITQVANTKDEGGRFAAQFVGGNRYMLCSQEDDGMTRYLAATRQGEQSLAFPSELSNHSAVVWKFEIVETELTGINATDTTQIAIKASKGRIHVSGATQWHLYNLQGREMPRTTTLPEGIYIIQTPNKTIKVNLTK